MSSAYGINLTNFQVNHPLALVGNPNVNRRDMMKRITGQAVFTQDIRPSDLGVSQFIYMGFVVCPYPRAKVVSIDVSRAEAAGYATVTMNDLPFYNQYSLERPYNFLAGGSLDALYAGHPVVAVGAPDPALVEDAIDLVSVDFQPLPYVLDAEEALKPSAPQLYANGNSPAASLVNGELVPSSIHVTYGDIDTAFQQADAIVDTRIDSQFLEHENIEPVTVIANWVNDNLYLYGHDKDVSTRQATLASYFGMPLSNIIIRTALGGAEGGQLMGAPIGNGGTALDDQYIVAAVMSKKVGAPVKYGGTRYDNTSSSISRFPVRSYVKLGGTSDGHLTAVQATLYSNCGARGTSEGSDTLATFYLMYNVPNVDVSLWPMNTDAYNIGATMRDVGESQAHIAIETVADMLAEKLGIDPVQFRLTNMTTSATAVNPVTHLPYTGFPQPASMQHASAAFGWSTKWQGWGVPSSVSGTKRRGVGVAIMNSHDGAVMSPCTGQIQLSPNGTVTVYTSHTDQGAGGGTSHAIMAAEALGLTSLSNIVMVMSDTSLTTNSSGTFSSQANRNGGIAILCAAQNLASQWFPTVAAAMAPGTKATNLVFGNNTIYDSTNPSNSISFANAAALLKAPITGSGSWPVPTNVAWRTAATRFMEVEVDVETADVRLVSAVVNDGAGRVLFAKGANSQALGGLVGTGMAEALYAETLQDPSVGLNLSGGVLNQSYLDYKIPTILEAPDGANITVQWEEYIDPKGPFGAVGIGEPVHTAVSPAIANALSNALGGYRFSSIPIRREDIVAAIQWMQATGKL